ncbi:MAG: hypothetical protein WDW38_005454 [Sanguina aurantia]
MLRCQRPLHPDIVAVTWSSPTQLQTPGSPTRLIPPPEKELELQQYVLFATAVHAGIGLASAVMANQADAISPVEGFARGFFFGVTGMFEVYHVTDLKLKAAQ